MQKAVGSPPPLWILVFLRKSSLCVPRSISSLPCFRLPQPFTNLSLTRIPFLSTRASHLDRFPVVWCLVCLSVTSSHPGLPSYSSWLVKGSYRSSFQWEFLEIILNSLCFPNPLAYCVLSYLPFGGVIMENRNNYQFSSFTKLSGFVQCCITTIPALIPCILLWISIFHNICWKGELFAHWVDILEISSFYESFLLGCLQYGALCLSLC